MSLVNINIIRNNPTLQNQSAFASPSSFNFPVFNYNANQYFQSLYNMLMYNTPIPSGLSWQPSGDYTKIENYNSVKGEKLAKTIVANTVGFTGNCARYVRTALEANGLGNGERGSGYKYADILSRNPNFKEISTANLDLSKLPPGCILVYGRGVANYSSDDGHVEVTLGNGKAASDGITNNIRAGARVFIPV